MSEADFKEQSMIKIKNKLSLRELFRRIDFVFILIAGLLFLGFCVYQDFIHDQTFIGRHDGYMSITDCGIGVLMLAGIFAHARWKFVYGSEEYRQKIRANFKRHRSREEIRKGYIMRGTTPCCALLIILIFWCIVGNFWHHQYFKALICLGIEIFFCLIFYLLIRK
jgi:hypothetical protein